MLSMTGQGDAFLQEDGVSVSVELRTVNSRYFKFTCRPPEGFGGWDSRLEAVVREFVRRGTIYLDLDIQVAAAPDSFAINQNVLKSYLDQATSAGLANSEHLQAALLALPGVVDEQAAVGDKEALWPLAEIVLRQALQRLADMRASEGQAMAKNLLENCSSISTEMSTIESLAPTVAKHYRDRLTERLNSLLQEHQLEIEPAEIAREVGIFADRCDVSEEIVRMQSHVSQFTELCEATDCSGKKLEFLLQEMFREINTIGSKANNVDIARGVIDVKAAIERMREMIQNVE